MAQRPKIAFQFYIYDLLLKDHDVVRGRRICNSVYSTADLFRNAPATVPLNESFFNAVTQRLKVLLDEMTDMSVPFRRTEDRTACAYCDFKTICGR